MRAASQVTRALSFADKTTAALFSGRRVRSLPPDIHRRAYAKLQALDAADNLDFLREEVMAPLGLSANALAKALHVPPNRFTAILNGSRSITDDTALRLARYFTWARTG